MERTDDFDSGLMDLYDVYIMFKHMMDAIFDLKRLIRDFPKHFILILQSDENYGIAAVWQAEGKKKKKMRVAQSNYQYRCQ